MKYLTLDEFFGETVNQKTGMSVDIEWKYKQQCYEFITLLNKYFQGESRSQCISM